MYQACSTSSSLKHSKLIHKSFKEPPKETFIVIVTAFFFSFIVAVVVVTAVSDIIIIFIVAVTVVGVVVIISSVDCFSCMKQWDKRWIDIRVMNTGAWTGRWPGGYSKKNRVGLCGPLPKTPALAKNSKPYLRPDTYIKTLFQTCITERFSIECRKTKTRVITLANHKGHR